MNDENSKLPEGDRTPAKMKMFSSMNSDAAELRFLFTEDKIKGEEPAIPDVILYKEYRPQIQLTFKKDDKPETIYYFEAQNAWLYDTPEGVARKWLPHRGFEIYNQGTKIHGTHGYYSGGARRITERVRKLLKRTKRR